MPQHKRGPWSQTEDQLLIHLVSVHGASNWVRISTQIQTRSPKQCRERFHQNLKPNLNHEPITPDEGVLIEQMVAEMGKRWAEIARRLRGRSDNAVKNWWNGGMNRRRRSTQHRRTELEVRHQHHHQQQQQQQQQHHQIHAHPQMHGLPSLMQQQPLPPAFQHMMPQQFFAPPMYHAPQHISVASNIPTFGRHGMMIETPLPSPSAFSQMSADGAPSLISDSSSMSARSPNHGASPIELPPLSGPREDRRRSSAPMLRLGVPGAFVQDADYGVPHMHMQRYDDHHHQQQHHHHLHKAPQAMLQEPFMPHALPQPTAFLPSQPRQPSPLQQQFDPSAVIAAPVPVARRHSGYVVSSQHQHQQQQRVPSTPAIMQLPSIGKLAPDDKMDPNMHTPVALVSSPDGSPKDKMSLSNLTH